MAATQYLPISELNKLISYVRYATRVVSDGVTATSTALTSATAAFTAADVGAAVSGAGIQNGTTIASVTNGTTVVLSLATTASASGVSVTITQTAALATPVLATALNGAFGAAAGNIQTWVDTTSGQTTQCVVDCANNTVFSVPLGSSVGFNNGVWTQYTAAQMTANFIQYFTS